MCVSWGWVENLLIWLVVVGVVFALLRLLVPFILSKLGIPLGDVWAIILRACSIVLTGIILVALILFIFGLIGCLTGGMPSLIPHR